MRKESKDLMKMPLASVIVSAVSLLATIVLLICSLVKGTYSSINGFLTINTTLWFLAECNYYMLDKNYLGVVELLAEYAAKYYNDRKKEE